MRFGTSLVAGLGATTAYGNGVSPHPNRQTRAVVSTTPNVTARHSIQTPIGTGNYAATSGVHKKAPRASYPMPIVTMSPPALVERGNPPKPRKSQAVGGGNDNNPSANNGTMNNGTMTGAGASTNGRMPFQPAFRLVSNLLGGHR